MMKLQNIGAIGLLALMILSSCKKENMGDCFKAVGKQTTETRQLPPFSKIIVEKNVDVVLVPDTAEYVVVSCGDNLIDLIKTEVNGGMLSIANHNKCNWVRNLDTPIKAEVHVKKLAELYFKGSGSITCTDTLRNDNLLIDCYDASGNVDLWVHNGWNVISQHTGNADVKLQGWVATNTMFSGGNGFLDCRNLLTTTANVRHSGTGEFYVYASNELNVRIELIGNVYYFGHPPVINKTILSTGRLIEQ